MRALKYLFVVELVAANLVWSAPAGDLLENGGFESGTKGWTIEARDAKISKISTDQAATGTHSLHIRDADSQAGSEVFSARLAVSAGTYELRGQIFPVSGKGLGIYVQQLRRTGKPVQLPKQIIVTPSGTSNQWNAFNLVFQSQPDTAFIQLWIHSFGESQVEAYLDDLELTPYIIKKSPPPWTAQYKIRPDEKKKLTAADVIGPDGLVYPNWVTAGVQGGIRRVAPVVKVDDFGAAPNSGRDVAEALEKAVAAAASKGGGAVIFSDGTYHLDRPVTIRENNIVLRGQGAKRTKLIFRYALPKGGASFYWPKAGARIGSDTPAELHCRPTGLMKMKIVADNEVVLTEWERSKHSGNSFMCRGAFSKLANGPHKLVGMGEYEDGSSVITEVEFTLDRSAGKTLLPNSQFALCFQGGGAVGPKLGLAKDGKRGDTVLELSAVTGLVTGDTITLVGPATDRWKQLTQNKCEHGSYRVYHLRIERIEGQKIFVNQPLRIEFPVVDNSYVQKIAVIQNCGLEDLYIEQTENLWITSASFEWAWNCWAKGVTVRKCGRNPVYAHNAKWCEIRDCIFDDAWFKGGGGTAYAGWEVAWDCLMENVETFKLRHAPLVQWAASGCVIRKGVFHDSDAQWHSGWTHENLFEQCIVTSTVGNGSYGFGMWGSPPEDDAHGPNGPRNVIYNCDVSSPKDGLWMGGMNEGWIIAHNRFVVEKGAGVSMKTFSFDHTILGNVFVLRDTSSPMVQLQTADCSGVEILNNILSGGSGRFTAGMGEPLVQKGNRVVTMPGPSSSVRSKSATPVVKAALPRPLPVVPSIYEWQLRYLKSRPAR
jgi:hypothetical protein